MLFVCRTADRAGISGVTNERSNPSLLGGVVADVPRCSPVKLAGQCPLPEFVIVHATVIKSPGRAE
jgi:hypothetical protein